MAISSSGKKAESGLNNTCLNIPKRLFLHNQQPNSNLKSFNQSVSNMEFVLKNNITNLWQYRLFFPHMLWLSFVQEHFIYKYSPKWKGKDCWCKSNRIVLSPSYNTCKANMRLFSRPWALLRLCHGHFHTLLGNWRLGKAAEKRLHLLLLYTPSWISFTNLCVV